MKAKKARLRPLLVGAAIGLGLIGGALVALSISAVHAQIARIQGVNALLAAQNLPNFTLQQRDAIVRAQVTVVHPKMKDLYASERIARFAKMVRQVMSATPAETLPTPAGFLGNQTAILTPGPGAFVLHREADCSITKQLGTYAFNSSLTTPLTIQPGATTPNLEQTLHTDAGLTTTAGVFASGCNDLGSGTGSKRGVYLGKTTSGSNFYAGAGYYSSSTGNALWYGTMATDSMAPDVVSTDASDPGVNALAAGDLDGNGMRDIVGLDALSPTFSVWLANTDGTLKPPTSYTLPGTNTEGGVVADVNGDGKLDVVVATRDANFNEQISILTGNGDGTLNAAQSFSVPQPSGTSNKIETLIAVDLRGSGHLDLVASNGLVLLNNGSGTFTPATAAAFVSTAATSDYGPNLVAADFNKDGKPDLAVDFGEKVTLYLGKGDGTFTVGNSYASIDDVGYISATDLDGDGNVDLFIGLADGGTFGGDQFGPDQAYALMGNGDGTFQGAPVLPFVYMGTNLADLNGDKNIDAIGVNSDLSLTTYLGNGSGSFVASTTLATSPVTVNGSAQTMTNIDSLAIGDIDGDGVPDVVYVATNQNQVSGLYFAKGDGHGGFTAPVALPTPSFVTAPALDIGEAFFNVRLADVNHDGKLDLVYCYNDTNSQTSIFTGGTSVQLGNGDGTFGTPTTIPYYSGAYTSSSPYLPTSRVQLIADLNKDGNPDLVFVTQTSSIDQTLGGYVTKVQVALGNGDGTFGAPTDVAGPDLVVVSIGPGQSSPVALADMNGDGIPDLVILGSDTTYDVEVAIALGNGDGTFKAPIKQIYSGQSLNGIGLAVADFDGDGKQDVAITNPYSLYASGIALGNGDGTLQSTGSVAYSETYFNYDFPLNVGGATVALDLNGDGKIDLIAGSVELLSQAVTAGGGSTGGGTGGGTPDFTVADTPTTGSAAAGSSVNTTVTLTPSNGFAQSVSLSCTGLPAGAACAFAPATVSVSGSAATSALTITTTGSTAMSTPNGFFNPLAPAGTILAALSLPLIIRRRGALRSSASSCLLLLVLVGGALLNACGGDHSNGAGSGGSGTGGSGTGGTPGTPAGTYSVTITATAGTTVHTVAYTLTVT